MTALSERRDKAIRDSPSYKDPVRKQRKRKRHVDSGSGRISRKERTSDLAASSPTATFPRHERMAIMLDAVGIGVPAAAKKYEMSSTTLYGWFREEGGLTEVREYVESRMEVSFHESLEAAFEELKLRMAGATDAQLFATLRKKLQTEAGAGGSRGRGKSGESGNPSEGAQVPGVSLIFNTPPASLPEGKSTRSSSKGNDSPSDTKPDVDAEEGKFSVFDE